jgi:hypothetical protein
MQNLVGRLRGLGQAPAVKEPSQVAARVAKGGHNVARAIRNWRVVLDKICTIITMVVLQEAIGDWCPESSAPASLRLSQPSVEEIYAELIADARPLPPLKSKELPAVAASSCIHPVKQLKGGGNKSGSWIVCKACHSRWESPFRATEVHEEVKAKKGSLNQEVNLATGPMDMELEATADRRATSSLTAFETGDKLVEMENYMGHRLQVMAQELSHIQASTSSQGNVQIQRLGSEMQQLMVQMCEKELQQEAMFRMLMEKTDKMQQKAQSQASMDDASSVSGWTQAATVVRPHKNETIKVKCNCNLPAEQYTVKKEGPRQGQTFWKCVRRQCQFFHWDQLEAPPVLQASPKKTPKTSQTSYSVVDLVSEGEGL